MQGRKSVLWTEEFAPKKMGGLVGNADVLKTVRIWALNWERGRKQKPLLFFGPTGTGKTLLAELVAKELGWQLFELNASDFRTRDVINNVAGAAALNASFSGKKRLVLLDEVDGVHGREDKGGLQAIISLLKEAQQPVILTANDIYSNKKLAGVRGVCTKAEFKRPRYTEIAKFLQRICDLQGIDYDLSSLNKLAKNSHGDIRSALLDLQSIAEHSKKIILKDVEEFGFRERQARVFELLQKIFHAKTVQECQGIRKMADISGEMLFLWVEENIPRHFTKEPDLENAFEKLSRADVFNGRIYKRQHYGFLRYSSELMTSGVSVPRKNHYPGFVSYKFPGILSSLSASMGRRALKKQVAETLQEKVHGSAKRIMSELPYYKALFKNSRQAAALSAGMNLDLESAAFLLGVKKDSKKASQLFEEAQKLNAKKAQKPSPETAGGSSKDMGIEANQTKLF